MITYNDIYESLRKERYSEQLQPITKNFVSEVSQYISEKKKLSENQNDSFSDEASKLKKQLENTVSIFKELMLLRKKKLLGLVFVASETGISKRDFDNMLDFEKEMFDKIMENVEQAEKKLSNQFNNKEIIQNENQMKMILFTQDLEEFVDFQGNQLGPFKKGEIANLDQKIADILIDDKKAELASE